MASALDARTVFALDLDLPDFVVSSVEYQSPLGALVYGKVYNGASYALRFSYTEAEAKDDIFVRKLHRLYSNEGLNMKVRCSYSLARTPNAQSAATKTHYVCKPLKLDQWSYR